MGFFNWFKKPKKDYEATQSESYNDDGWIYNNQNTSPMDGEVFNLSYRTESLLKNDPNTEKGLRVIENNVVGNGITPQAVSRSNNSELVRRVEAAIIAYFDSKECDASQVTNFYGMQNLALREMVKNGNCFIRRRPRSFSQGLTVPMQYQVLSYDYLATDMLDTTNGNNRIINGIEYNRLFQPVAYHFYKENPRDYSQYWTARGREIVRVRASSVYHLYRRDQVDQRIGISWFTPVLPTLRMLANYRNNVLTKQQIQSSITAFITTDEDGDVNKLLGKRKSDGKTQIKRGQLNRLRPGEDVKFPDMPDISGDTEFYKQFRFDIANALGISYEELSGDYSNVNFSSGRMGWIAMSRNIQSIQQNIFGAQFLKGVGEDFLNNLVLQGDINAAERADVYIKWVYPRRVMLDPVKETNAILSQISGKIKSRKQAIEEMGYDYFSVMEEIAFDRDTQNSLGISDEQATSQENSQENSEDEEEL